MLKIVYRLPLNTYYLFLNSPYATALIDRQPSCMCYDKTEMERLLGSYFSNTYI